MRKRGLASTIFIAALVVILAVVLAVTYVITKNYVVVGWQLFPRHQEVLDIRQITISTREYDKLAWQMPDSQILWSIPFQGSSYAQDSKELTITELEEEDIHTVGYFRNLEAIHAENCTNYESLALLAKTYPDVNVDYNVPIGGQNFPASAQSITVTTLPAEEAAMLSYLPKLTTIDGSGCRNFDILRQVQQNHPEWKVVIMTTIAGTSIAPDATTLELDGAAYEELSVGLAAMPGLKSLLVRHPASDGESMMKLCQEYPNIEIHWEIEAAGRTYREDVTELDLSASPIGSIETAKEIASKFPYLEKLIVDSGSISNEEMAKFRNEVRDSYKVVWTVYFTDKAKARTDETYFMPIKQGEYYFQDKNSHNLRYCEDMVCIDLGHSTVKDISFVSYMPHLKYLILAWTQVTDITPLSSCKELIYLELDHGIIHDFTPLQGCTALEDLNINDQMVRVSIEPLCKMTWLKNLWCVDRKYSDKVLLTESLPDTNVPMQNYSTATGMGWRNLQNYYDMRDYLGMYYMD